MQANYYPTTVTPQRPPVGYDMNHLYLSPSNQPANRGGIFYKRNEKIDWRRIAAVDVDRIAREMDFQALQDNLEQITLCNIDAEIDSRAMDPNFVKLYKMSQLTIEYLLTCQDQIATQLADYEQVKSKGSKEQEDARRYIDNLREDLAKTKKESKQRRKMLETQQRMLVAQNSNYHTCPVCTHAFLSATYLQNHMKRRHPDYDPSRRREHDVDIEKEIHRLKDELNKKDHEFQLMKAQKTHDEEKIRDRDSTIRELRGKIDLKENITAFDDKYSHMTTNTHAQLPSSHANEAAVSELLKENKSLYADIEKHKKLYEQSEKVKKRLEREIEKLQIELSTLKDNHQLIQNASGDTRRLVEQLTEEKLLRKKLQGELQDANNQLSQYRNQPPPVIDRKSPALPTRSNESPVPTPVQTRPTRPIQTTELILSEYCPRLAQRLKDNPKYLTKYRDEAKKQYTEELEEYESLGISETDTRLTDLDFRTKMESVLQTRRNIQNDLPDFERIRANLNRTLDKLTNERLDLRRSITSIRSSGSKLVTFEDERHRQKQPVPIYDNTKNPSLDQQRRVKSKPKYDHSRPTTNNESGEDVTLSNANETDDDEDTQPTRPGIRTDIQPSPRKNIPPAKTTSGIGALVNANIRPSTASTASTISAVVRATPTTDKFDSESESESSVRPPVSDKTRIIERKLQEANIKGQKPGISVLAQGFHPSRESLANQNHDDESESLTTLHTNPRAKPSNAHLPQLSGRESVNNNPLSSGDISQHTYDSLWKSQGGKGTEFRRPTTADSAKTSNLDSDDNIDGEESN